MDEIKRDVAAASTAVGLVIGAVGVVIYMAVSALYNHYARSKA